MTERRRLDGLDGLRGLAAFLVLLHHAAPKVAGLNLLPGGYLAVDFFFMLSGFVIARGYEDRLQEGLTPGRFLLLRLRRLYPVIAVGIAAGAVVAMLRGMDPREAIIRLVIQALFLPLPAGSGSTFPLDGVEWSLMFELAANALHATILWRLNRRYVAIFTGIMLCALLFASLLHGSVALGDRGTNLWGGVPRVLFSYGAGIIVWRSARAGRLPAIRLSAFAISAMFCTTLLAAGVSERFFSAGFVEPLLVATSFPLILIAGIDVELENRARWIASLAGALSYPLYAVHLPVIQETATLLHRWSRIDGLAALALCMSAALLGAVALARFDKWWQHSGVTLVRQKASGFFTQPSLG